MLMNRNVAEVIVLYASSFRSKTDDPIFLFLSHVLLA